MGIANMMLYSINSDAAVVRRPYPANYCYIYNSHIFFSFSLFVYFIPPFLLSYSSGSISPSSSLLVQIGVGSPADDVLWVEC